MAVSSATTPTAARAMGFTLAGSIITVCGPCGVAIMKGRGRRDRKATSRFIASSANTTHTR